jgi:hypothetical protein
MNSTGFLAVLGPRLLGRGGHQLGDDLTPVAQDIRRLE